MGQGKQSCGGGAESAPPQVENVLNRPGETGLMAEQVDIGKENRKLEEMANDETYSDEQREEVRARLQRFQDEQKAINDQIHILKADTLTKSIRSENQS